jgi:hypothetical protein
MEVKETETNLYIICSVNNFLCLYILFSKTLPSMNAMPLGLSLTFVGFHQSIFASVNYDISCLKYTCIINVNILPIPASFLLSNFRAAIFNTCLSIIPLIIEILLL